jgi:MFS family permease
MSLLPFLDKGRSIARPGYSRWLIPPASLAIHLAIGQVYAFSVFKIPLTNLLGVDHHAPADWTQDDVFWIFSIAIAVLGLSTAVFGKWLERAGPRKAMFAAACCFAAGFFVSALGVKLHWLWLIYVGYGVVGGIGLGLGYLAPVANLIKWFPDHPGLATGMAIMGFGGGALIGSPLGTNLMNRFHTPTNPGVAETFVTMGALYFIFMMFGVFLIRIPPANYRPPALSRERPALSLSKGGERDPTAPKSPPRSVALATALRSPQFYLLWLVLCLNTSAGISIIEQASPLIQELFKNRFPDKPAAVAAAAGFVGFLSLFNMGGRFVWSAASDYIGRKATFTTFFVLGAILYAGITRTDARHLNSIALFVLCAAVLISMYGGGFSTMPAYLRDLYGTRDLNAIYGRLLTAWSVAGILGPILVNRMREYQLRRGTAPADAYTTTFYVMSALLVAGLICNHLVRPLRDDKYLPDTAATAATLPPTSAPLSDVPKEHVP